MDRVRTARRVASALFASGSLALAGCKSEPPPPAQAQLASDLPAQTVEQVLRSVAARGGPRGERVAAHEAGAAALVWTASTDASAQRPAAPDRTPGSSPAGAGPTDGGVAPADLRWELEPYGAMAAAARGELEPIPASGSDVSELWRDPGGTWTAIGGRAEVLLVGGALGEHPVPAKLTTLVEPWLQGKVALVAPLDGPALAHFAALFQAWGEPRMRAWLDGLRDNQVQLLESDEAVRRAVVEGRALVGLLTSDEAARGFAVAAHAEIVYPNQRSIGTFIWPTALSRPRGAPHAGAAAQLAEQLADRSSEQLLVAREPGFLPLRSGIPTPPGVRSATNLVVMSIDPPHIAAEIATRKQELIDWTARVRTQPKK